MSEAFKAPVLGIHTAEERLSLALATRDQILASLDEAGDSGRARHAERLAGGIQQLWQDAGLPRSAAVPVAVVVGPGSFTGVRTALAWAKGYALARQVSLVTLGTLEALAFQAGVSGRVAVWQDARRGEVFTALYRVEGPVLDPLEEPRCQDAPSWLMHLEALGREAPLHRVGPETRLQAEAVARLGALRLAAGLQDDPVSARPSYLREASATPNWRPLASPTEGLA